MTNQTYNERVNDIAEQMAKAEHKFKGEKDWHELIDRTRKAYIHLQMRNARIAVDLMADAYSNGYVTGYEKHVNGSRCNLSEVPKLFDLVSLGLKPQA